MNGLGSSLQSRTIPDRRVLQESITDLRQDDHLNQVVVDVTPTYSGCPATEVIEKSVVDALHDRGIENVKLNRVLSPPWTTDWITAEGREQLREYGIAPPAEGGSKRELLFGNRAIACPRCSSQNTEVVSEFGSTACKASYKCNDCLEPFEYFKCL